MNVTEVSLMNGIKLTVPTAVIPTREDNSLDPLAGHLALLFLEGRTECDSYDVGLSLKGQPQGEPPRGPFIIERPSLTVRSFMRKKKLAELSLEAGEAQKRNGDLTARVSQLETLVDRQGAALRSQMTTTLNDLRVALAHANLIHEVETYDRVLQTYSDKIHCQLDEDTKSALRSFGITYITKLLDPPNQNLSEEDMNLRSNLIDYALDCLSDAECRAANALLIVLNELKTGPGMRNTIQHPTPTIEEGIQYTIANARFDLRNETTIRATIQELNTSFLPADSESAVGALKRKIHNLEQDLATLAPANL